MTSFTDLGLPPILESALATDGITEPTAIQTKAIPILLAGSNGYLSSETGTGKTLAYLLPVFTNIMVAKIDADQRTLQSIVLVPTHELAMQICELGNGLARDSGVAIRLQALIGGVSIKRQVEKLKSKPHIIVGTAGRINELIDSKKIKPHTVKQVVVDEADRLLVGDSLHAIRRIINSVPRQRQLAFASATQRPESSQEAESLAPDLVQIDAGVDRVNPVIEHFYVECEKRDKPDLLRKLLHALHPERAIVFMHRNDNAEVIAQKLAYHKISVADLHGAQDNMQRKKAMDDFRGAKANVLIASDIAARGLDIKGVTHVFNFDIPTHHKDYLHRVGRTSRAGSPGCAVSLMTAQEVRLVKRYQSELHIVMRAGRLREGVFDVGDES
jgi:superfamily II DNA/RNA helicase